MAFEITKTKLARFWSSYRKILRELQRIVKERAKLTKQLEQLQKDEQNEEAANATQDKFSETIKKYTENITKAIKLFEKEIGDIQALESILFDDLKSVNGFAYETLRPYRAKIADRLGRLSRDCMQALTDQNTLGRYFSTLTTNERRVVKRLRSGFKDEQKAEKKVKGKNPPEEEAKEVLEDILKLLSYMHTLILFLAREYHELRKDVAWETQTINKLASRGFTIEDANKISSQLREIEAAKEKLIDLTRLERKYRNAA